MIGYIEGRVIAFHQDSILLLAGHVGYEVLLDAITLEKVRAVSSGKENVCLYIYYHVTDRQPKPVLIGFMDPLDKTFFQLFISVAAVGPMKAVKALCRPIGEVARAIEQKDAAFLSKLPGIGKRTAEKIIATLHGKAVPFAAPSDPRDSGGPTVPESRVPEPAESADRVLISGQVADVLVTQLGHSAASAKRMIKEAFDRNPGISTPEDLFDEIYQEAP